MSTVVSDYSRKYDIVSVTDDSLELCYLVTKYILDIESEQTLFKYLDDHSCTLMESRDEIMEITKKFESSILPSE